MGGGSLFGLIMLIGSIVLYALGRIKPEIRRDSDIVYVFVGLIYGITTIASANMAVVPPGIVEFQNLLAIGCIVSLMWQNIRDRQNSYQPAPSRGEGAFDSLRQRFSGDSRRPNPPRNSGRPDNGVYRYEAALDDYDRFGEPRRDQRRIRGSEPARGYGDRYDEPGRGRPSLNQADRERNSGREGGFDDRGRGSRDEFGRPAPAAPDRAMGRSPRQSDWDEDNYVDGRRPPQPPSDGFGPDRNARRERNPGRGRGTRPRDDRSMEGRPLSRPLEDEPLPMGGPGNPASNVQNGPGFNGSSFNGPSPNGPTPNGPGPNSPVMDRPAIDMPPRRRPRTGEPSERPPSMGNRYSDGPSRRSPGSDRPVIDATPNPGRPPLTPPSGEPLKPLGAPPKDDYVDFKPVAPPPDSERDNSDQFDD